jgi:hypothetical protein
MRGLYQGEVRRNISGLQNLTDAIRHIPGYN